MTFVRLCFVGCKRETHRSVQQGISLHDIFSVVYMVSIYNTLQPGKGRMITSCQGERGRHFMYLKKFLFPSLVCRKTFGRSIPKLQPFFVFVCFGSLFVCNNVM